MKDKCNNEDIDALLISLDAKKAFYRRPFIDELQLNEATSTINLRLRQGMSMYYDVLIQKCMKQDQSNSDKSFISENAI